MKARPLVSGAAGAALAAALFISAHGQTLLQAGPSTPGHVPQYINQGAQAVVMDGGGSGGGILNTNPGEGGITSRSTMGVYPVVGTGNGPKGEHFCMYDAPTNNATGYHYLCFDPNATGSQGLIDYGAAGAATPQALLFTVNGTPVGNLTAMTVGVTAISGGTTGDVLYNNGGLLGNSALGTGVLTAFGVNPGTSGSVVINGGALGTPSSGVMDHLTGTPAALVLTNATGTPAALGLANATGTPAAIDLANGTNLPTSALATGTGVGTALGINVGTAGSIVVNGGALGVPSSATLTSATGLPISTGVSGLGSGVAAAAGNSTNGASGIVVENSVALIAGSHATVNLAFSATAPTFTSGACVGAIGVTNGSAAFTFTTGSGSCGSTATIGMPLATTGWVCDAFDEAIVGVARIQESADSSSSVVFTNYSIGSSPAATNFLTGHTVKVKCAAY